MDRSQLAARIQEILRGRPAPAPTPGSILRPDDEEVAFAARCAADEAASAVLDVLGGRTIEGPAGRCVVVERCYEAEHAHGRQRVGRYAAAARSGMAAVPWFLRAGNASGLLAGEDEPAPPDLLFFDLETTGLSGGAGTYAFLVGCGRFEGEAFHTRQFFLRGYGEERALLEAVRAFIAAMPAAGGEPTAPARPCLVSYNGRGFDLPLIETRYLFHRSASPFTALAHVDMLFPARRLWRRRLSRDAGMGSFDRAALAAPADLRASCSLTALEQDILGLQRYDDVPGWEIPGRFFAYARTGDARGLVAVLEHNRLDLLSLAAVTAVILEQVIEQDRLVNDRPGCLALARLLEHLGREADAERCYERAAAEDGLMEGHADRLARAEALYWVARHHRRERRFLDAAEAWQGLLRIPGIEGDLRREACEALAVHHEHRAKDLEAARSFALTALGLASTSRAEQELQHRLGRLARKLTSSSPDRAWLE